MKTPRTDHDQRERETPGGTRPGDRDQAPASVLDPRGRRKAYRPLPEGQRRAAVERGLAAYARGAFYLAHEELELAWMATAGVGERERLGGLIKLAAAGVHAARGNPAGVATNLRGARERLHEAAEAGADGGLDLRALLAAVDDGLARVEGLAETPETPVPDPPAEVGGPPGRARRAPLDVQLPAIARRTTP